MTEPAYRISCEPSQTPVRIVASGSKAEFYSDLRKRTGATAFMVDAQGNRTPVGATSQATTVAAAATQAPSPTQDAAALRSEAREYAGLSTSEREALWRTNPAKAKSMLRAREAQMRGLLDGAVTHNGRSYDQLTNAEKVHLHQTDREKFDRMRFWSGQC